MQVKSSSNELLKYSFKIQAVPRRFMNSSYLVRGWRQIDERRASWYRGPGATRDRRAASRWTIRRITIFRSIWMHSWLCYTRWTHVLRGRTLPWRSPISAGLSSPAHHSSQMLHHSLIKIRVIDPMRPLQKHISISYKYYLSTLYSQAKAYYSHNQDQTLDIGVDKLFYWLTCALS